MADDDVSVSSVRLPTRIPLTIVATATGHETHGKAVAVWTSELDALEAEITALRAAQDVEQADRVERFRRALMESHADRWSMEDIAQAAHVCAETERRQEHT